MKDIYKQIWLKAKPYYEKGRPFDIKHIEWMMKDATLVCKKENLDDSILLPLVILHDVGYAEVDSSGNTYNLDIRRAHMKAGADITQRILEELNYPEDKTEKIVKYVSVHDNWAFDENYRYTEDKLLGSFNDLDYMWMSTKEGFHAAMEMMKKTPKEMFEYLANNVKPIKRPFSTKTAKDLYTNYMNDRQQELIN